jgi:hypothetical protein
MYLHREKPPNNIQRLPQPNISRGDGLTTKTPAKAMVSFAGYNTSNTSGGMHRIRQRSLHKLQHF